MDVPRYATLSGLERGPESCGSRGRGSQRSSNRSLEQLEVNEALEGATSKILGDVTQEIWAKLEPLIPSQVSPTNVGVSPHRVQANHLVAGLTNTLGSLRSRPMPAVRHREAFLYRERPSLPTATWQLHKSRAGTAGADSPKGNG